jgi:DNA polymerase bacteriophage-type
MSSLKKYPAFIERTRDGVLRDTTMYHAASTGRAGGTGIQPHNFPRGSLKDTDLAIDMIMQSSTDELKMLYGANLSPLFSSCLRGMFTAAPSKILEVADYSSIEVRVLFWLANHSEGLRLFIDKKDPYVAMAIYLLNKKAEEITPEERQLGKAVILGSGFGLGWKKFIITAKLMYGLEVDEPTAKRAINTYRQVHKPVKDMWYNYERGFINAIENPRTRTLINKCTFFIEKEFLKIRLPSGRDLSYFRPSVFWGKTDWGDSRKQIKYWGEDSQTKQWRPEKTYGGKIAENVTQAVARDIMESGKVNIEKSGREVLLTVHDEIVAQGKPPGDIKEFERLICTLPAWAKGCPIDAKGYTSFRYKKG